MLKFSGKGEISMRDRYWAMFCDLKYKERYYWHYQIRARRINGLINGICLLTTSASVANWFIWQHIPIVWSLLIISAQAIQVLKPLFPFSKQIDSLKFLIPAIDKLIIDVDYSWNQTHQQDEKQISKLIKKYESQYIDLNNQFINEVYFPVIKNCEDKAQTDTINFFYQRYHVKPKEE